RRDEHLLRRRTCRCVIHGSPAHGGPTMIQTPTIELRPILPELLICAFAIAGMLYEAFVRRSSHVVHLWIALVGLAAAAVAAISLWSWAPPKPPYVLGDAVAVDRFSV